MVPAVASGRALLRENASSTAFSSSSVSNGFRKNRKAPSSRTFSLVSSSSKAVTTITGMLLVLMEERSLSITVMPLPPGILMSRITRSGSRL